MSIMESVYLFSISAPHNRIQALGDHFDGPDYFIVKHDEDERPPTYSFGSPHLNSLVEPSEIWARGMGLRSLVNGALNLDFNPTNYFFSSSNLLTFSNLYIAKEDRDITPRAYYEIPQSYPYCSVYIQKAFPQDAQPVGVRAKAIFESRSNEKIRTLLLQLGNGLDWVNLYSILDTVQTFCKQAGTKEFSKVLKKCSLTDDDVGAFTGTVNNYGVLGVSARHGITKNTKPPKRIATISESQSIVIQIANAYLEMHHGLV